LNYPGVVNTDEQHVAERDGILARYELNEIVPCSLKNRHRHMEGVVTQMLCGITIRMGLICGGRSIVGFDELMSEYRRRVSYNKDVDVTTGWADRFEQRILTLEPALNVRLTLFHAIESHNPKSFFQDLWNRSKGGAAALNHDGQTLAGLEIMKARRFDPAKLRGVLADFRRQWPPHDVESAKALRLIAKRGNELADECEAWIRETVAFTSKSNLELAVRAAYFTKGRVEERKSGAEGWYVYTGPGLNIFVPKLRLLEHTAPGS
jgi:hypothetical protein